VAVTGPILQEKSQEETAQKLHTELSGLQQVVRAKNNISFCSFLEKQQQWMSKHNVKNCRRY
jgi:hypothetical protein